MCLKKKPPAILEVYRTTFLSNQADKQTNILWKGSVWFLLIVGEYLHVTQNLLKMECQTFLILRSLGIQVLLRPLHLTKKHKVNFSTSSRHTGFMNMQCKVIKVSFKTLENVR